MAESKRTFQAARMDKDIDDRLLKSGQYRDGLNISIDTSEDANVGAVENLKGNELILNQDIYGLSSTTNPNAEVVGSYSHPEEEKIYYFVTGDRADGIFEHDIKANKVNTIVIDSLVPNLADTKEIKCGDISAAGYIAQDGTISVSSKLGDTKVITNKLAVNATGAGVSKTITTETEVPSIYKNGGDKVVCTIEAIQPSITAPDVVTKGPSNIADVSAKVNGFLTNDSVNVTSQGFYYGYKTDGSTLTLDELKNGGTDVTRYTITISSPNIKNEFSGDLINLVADKLISYAAFATNAVGTTDGEIKTLTTATTIYSITGLGFNNTSVSNLGGVEVFEVTGTPGATYTLAGSSGSGSDGATPAPGTHTIGNSGSNTHNITISAQTIGAPARNPAISVVVSGSTVFLPVTLPSFDTISQAAGAAQTYTYTLNLTSDAGNNATLKTTPFENGAAYTGFSITEVAGYSNTAEQTFYVFPDAGWQYDQAPVLVSGLPSWASVQVVGFDQTNSAGHTYLEIAININNTPSNNDTASATVTAPAGQVTTAWSQGLWESTANPSLDRSPTADSGFVIYGTGTFDKNSAGYQNHLTDTITASNDQFFDGVNSITSDSTFGGDLISTVITPDNGTYPSSENGTVDLDFAVTIPSGTRKSNIYTQRPISVDFAGGSSSLVITSGAYTSTAGVSYFGGTKIFRVTGDIGATYRLRGVFTSGNGTYILNSSPFDHSLSVGANTACGAGSRTISTTLTPTGSTVLQGGAAEFVSSSVQAASGNVSFTWNPAGSGSATHTNSPSNITTINGVDHFTPGAQFSFSITVSGVPVNPSTGSYPSWNSVGFGSLEGTKENGSYTTNAAESSISGTGPNGIAMNNGVWQHSGNRNLNGTYTGTVTLGGGTNYKSIRIRLFSGIPSGSLGCANASSASWKAVKTSLITP